MQLKPSDASDIVAAGADAHVVKELFYVCCIGIGALVRCERINTGFMIKRPAGHI